MRACGTATPTPAAVPGSLARADRRPVSWAASGAASGAASRAASGRASGRASRPRTPGDALVATLVVSLLVSLTALPACTNPDIAGNVWSCQSDDECGAGWVCSTAHECVPASAAGGDATVDAGAGADVREPADTAASLAEPDTRPADAYANPDTHPADALTDADTGPVDAQTEPDTRPADGGLEDADTEPDTHLADAGAEPDTHPADASAEPDTHLADASAEPDTRPADASAEPDTHPADARAEPDTHLADAGAEPDTHLADAGAEPDTHLADASAEPDTDPGGADGGTADASAVPDIVATADARPSDAYAVPDIFATGDGDGDGDGHADGAVDAAGDGGPDGGPDAAPDGAVDVADAAGPYCGDGTCDPSIGETCRICPEDCDTEGAEPEFCDGQDNDCDGLTDDDLPDARPCEIAVDGIGVCHGTETCIGAMGWLCDARLPTAEDCDGIDDDCDGATDEDLHDPVAAGCATAGVCADGAVTAACVGGQWRCDHAAVPDWEPVEARCDGLDNDCDGLTDEDLTHLTSATDCAAVGVCAAGVPATCGADGTWECQYAAVDHHEAAETSCDGRDNDCDGLTDEELADPAAAGCAIAGACAAGGVTAACADGAWRCDYAAVPDWEPVEARCDGVDNDCDGQTDEDLTHLTSETDCAAVGVCAAGVPATCGAGGAWECQYAAVDHHEATETSCDGRDNDCDGETDEDACAGAGEPCDADADCAGLPCRLDIDGSGRFCAVTETDCVLALQDAVAAPIPDGYVHCLGDVSFRRCEEGRWSAGMACEDDGDPCTTNRCQTGPGCTPGDAPEGTPCDDDDACTTDDACAAGLCGGAPVGCDDGVDCTVDTCDPALGCQHAPDDAACAAVGCGMGVCDPAEGCVGDAPRCDCLALGFRGHERIVTADDPAFSGGPGVSRTFEAWFRLDALREGDWGSPILTKLDDPTSGDWALLAVGPDLVFRFFPAGSPTPVEVRAVDVLAVDTWTHAAAVFDRDAGAVSLYRDGALVAMMGNLLDMADTDAPVRVGPTPALPFGIFEGTIDEVRIWSTARSGAAITADHARPLTGAEPDLAAYWPFADTLDAIAAGSASLTAAAPHLAYDHGAFVPLVRDTSPYETPVCPTEPPVRLFFSQRTLADGDRGPSVELFNASDHAIWLADYKLNIFQEGSEQEFEKPRLPEVLLEANAALVVCLGGEESIHCDHSLAPTFDGNDTLTVKASGAFPWHDVEDAFGRVGEDPGEGWGTTVPSTAPVLRRACAVTDGDPDEDDPFDPAAEWQTGDPTDVTADRRLHCGVCGGVRCPGLFGYAVRCNEQNHCEYDADSPSAVAYSPPLIFVPPSVFPMGASVGGGEDTERPQHEVAFDAGFYIHKFEITAHSYRNFLKSIAENECSAVPDGECLDMDAAERNLDWTGSSAVPHQSCQDQAFGPPDQSCNDHAVVGITWYGARAFCDHVGARLCAEAEWERAAKGTEHRTYPWGEALPGEDTANCREADCKDGFLGTSPVGYFLAAFSPVGAYDMAGNAAEWCEDDWHQDYDGAPVTGTAWRQEPRSGTFTRRGGTYDDEDVRLSTTGREPAAAFDGDGSVGFRCCRSAP